MSPDTLIFRDRVRNSDIREGLRVEPLLLNIKLSRSRWFMQLAMMPSGCLLSEVFQACTTQEIQMHEDTMKRLRVLRDF